jgi:hypothetical protein
VAEFVHTKYAQTHEGYPYTHVNTNVEERDITLSFPDKDSMKLLLVKYVNNLEFSVL